MQQAIFFLFAIVAGVMLPVQAGLNTEIGRSVKDPVYASLISFVIGTIGLVLYLLLARADWGEIRNTASLPWYYWTGGLMGAVYVAAIVVLTPRLGVALTFGLTVAAQMVFGVIMDHYGWLGVPKSPINWMRVLGVLLIIAGVVIVRVNQTIVVAIPE
ncbi:DMT family transporter [Neolewinella antarctica]|uniref:Transporter family-2 protein n=1 Tax=Neolewinella antarctica TaxID=442734 RepID=A0ABX0X6M7_9BACT|nr:DMT family transporter [Neolewinella antarctica]NJC24867.1 transporter family-2 protein [Neolewinella antarctica]